MFRISLLVPSLVAGLLSTAAMASTPQGGLDGRSIVPPQADGIRLAQARDVEVYFDGDGNRVIVDAYTGEVIAHRAAAPQADARGRAPIAAPARTRPCADALSRRPVRRCAPLRRRGDYDPQRR